LPINGGIAFTTVWQADFDHNSRPDLLIAAHSAKSGRCLEEVTLSFLLFNTRGQPVPWVIQSRAPYSRKFSSAPAIFADLSHPGGACRGGLHLQRPSPRRRRLAHHGHL
jgi:hypothetical protein